MTKQQLKNMSHIKVWMYQRKFLSKLCQVSNYIRTSKYCYGNYGRLMTTIKLVLLVYNGIHTGPAFDKLHNLITIVVAFPS